MNICAVCNETSPENWLTCDWCQGPMEQHPEICTIRICDNTNCPNYNNP